MYALITDDQKFVARAAEISCIYYFFFFLKHEITERWLSEKFEYEDICSKKIVKGFWGQRFWQTNLCSSLIVIHDDAHFLRRALLVEEASFCIKARLIIFTTDNCGEISSELKVRSAGLTPRIWTRVLDGFWITLFFYFYFLQRVSPLYPLSRLVRAVGLL